MTESANSSKTSDNRILWIDIAKVLSIFAVVISHMGWNKMYFTSFCVEVFFFCSGYMTKKRSVPRQLAKDVRKIAVPYLMVSLLSVLFAGLLRPLVFERGLGMEIGLYSVESILVPTFITLGWSIWWFMPNMFYGKTVLSIILNINRNKICVLISTIVILVAGAAGYGVFQTRGNAFWAMVTTVCATAVFMAFGYIASGIDIYKINVWVRLILAAVLGIAYVLLIHSGQCFDLGVRNISDYCIGLITSILGVLTVVLASSVIPSNRFFEYWGPRTLYIYCVHGLEHNFIPWNELMGGSLDAYPYSLVMGVVFVIRITMIFTLTWLVEKCIGVYFERKKQVL